MARTRFPPGPEGGLFGRHLIARNRSDPTGFMTELAARYGDIVHFRNGFQHVFFLNHPEYITNVLFTHYANFVKGRGINRRRRLLGEGLITSEGDLHRRQRMHTIPAFHRQRVHGYGTVMVDSAAEHVASWQDGRTVDILQEMRRVTMAIVGRTMFSFESVEEIQELSRALENSMVLFKPFKLSLGGLRDRLPLPGVRRARRADEYLEDQMCRMINERRRSGEDTGDLLSMLLAAYGEESGAHLTDNAQVRDEALTVFLAGYESTATSLLWTWYLLAHHPEVEAKLHAELDAVLGSRLPTAADVPSLQYTEMVFAETLRLYPPAWRLVRYAMRDYEVGGYVVPSGSLVVVSQYVMHRDARYFPDPLRFDPQRWTTEARDSRPQGAYFPFGGGPRRCIGEVFALMEGILVIATLARSWRLRLVAEGAVDIAAAQLLRPRHPMTMVTEYRAERVRQAATR